MSADENKAKPTIKPRENGSLRVDGLTTLIDATGGRIPTENHGKGNIALCCCGHSTSKPFCDGTHKKTDFRSSRLTDDEGDFRSNYVGDGIVVHDNRGICAHSGYCTDQLPEVFKAGEEPWIDADGAPPERVAEQTRRCPSGALSHSRDGTEHRDQERPATIKVTASGPYFVTGGVELLTSRWGAGASREHYALCRCGHSKNKPFCDGTHWHVDFDDPGLDTTPVEVAPDPENRMEIPEKDYERIDKAIHSDESPVGIDARKTHVMILYKLEQIEARLQRLADEVSKR